MAAAGASQRLHRLAACGSAAVLCTTVTTPRRTRTPAEAPPPPLPGDETALHHHPMGLLTRSSAHAWKNTTNFQGAGYDRSRAFSRRNVALCEPQSLAGGSPPTAAFPHSFDDGDVCVLERQHAGAPLVPISVAQLATDLAAPALRLILFGEVHDDDVAQRLQRRLYPPRLHGGARSSSEDEDADATVGDDARRSAAAPTKVAAPPDHPRESISKKKWALALEFVETDRRAATEAFLAAEDDPLEALFATAAEARRYGPLAVAAKRSANAILAANAPRRLVAAVAQTGPACLGDLDAADRDLLPPLPHAPSSEAYATRLKRFLGGGRDCASSTQRPRPPTPPPPPPSGAAAAEHQRHQQPAATTCPGAAARTHETTTTTNEERVFQARFVAAQTLRDATMAHAICDHLRARPTDGVFFVGGKFHVEGFLGVVDHLEHLLPGGLDRDEFRLIVAVPLAPDAFDRHAATGWRDVCDDPRVKAVADFLVFTRRPPSPTHDDPRVASSSSSDPVLT